MVRQCMCPLRAVRTSFQTQWSRRRMRKRKRKRRNPFSSGRSVWLEPLGIKNIFQHLSLVSCSLFFSLQWFGDRVLNFFRLLDGRASIGSSMHSLTEELTESHSWLNWLMFGRKGHISGVRRCFRLSVDLSFPFFCPVQLSVFLSFPTRSEITL